MSHILSDYEKLIILIGYVQNGFVRLTIRAGMPRMDPLPKCLRVEKLGTNEKRAQATLPDYGWLFSRLEEVGEGDVQIEVRDGLPINIEGHAGSARRSPGGI